MNNLRDSIAGYLELRRSLGFKLKQDEQLLLDFAEFMISGSRCDTPLSRRNRDNLSFNRIYALDWRGRNRMKIATFNVNGVNGRLPVLLQWLEMARPGIACLQELKAPQEKFPQAAIEKAGYGAIWHGQKNWSGVAILVRDTVPVETVRGLPDDADDTQSRYIEARIGDLRVGCLYPPNGNPAPGPKFDYKLRWFERLHAYALELVARNEPVLLAGDYNVMPTDLDVYNPARWIDDALFRPEVRAAFHRLVA